MGKRRSSRELALKFLYQVELNGGDLDELMKLFKNLAIIGFSIAWL